MIGSKALAAAANAACREKLVDIGFRKRAGSSYTCDLDQGIIGWLGLNSAGNRPDGPYEINPVVGVRHQEMEQVVADLCHRKPHPYTPPTISTPVGYVMPERSYRAWYFVDTESASDTAESLSEAVDAYGLPYMRNSATLAALTEQLRARRGHEIEIRLPVAYQLQGMPAEALEIIDEELGKMKDRSDAAAEYFRGFAAAFTQRYGQG